MKMEQPKKNRNWVFTRNNYTDKMLKDLDAKIREEVEAEKIVYAIVGKEIGEKGTPHLQGYVSYKNAVVASRIQKLCPGSFHEHAKGNAYSNFKYCSKEGDFVEYGERPEPKGQGKRSDIDNIKELIKEPGVTRKDIFENCSSFQAYKFGEIGLKLYSEKRTWKPFVVWLFGETGTGKSRSVNEHFDDLWVSGQTLNGFFFDGYDREENCHFEDLRPHDMNFHFFLKVLQHGTLRVRTIGGSTQFLAKTIVISTNKHPEDWAVPDEDIEQLLRRIDVIARFLKDDIMMLKGSREQVPWVVHEAQRHGTKVAGNYILQPNEPTI